MNADTSPELSGRPGDPPPPPHREKFNSQGINAYLDTGGGLALQAQHGSRYAAAQAIADGDRADLARRRELAESLADRYPNRYPTVGDAMRDVASPPGGGGAFLVGTAEEIARAFTRVDPLCGARVIGEEKDRTSIALAAQGPDGRYAEADTRPPWRRG